MTISVLAAERIDTWVVRFSIAIPLVCIAGLVLWHLTAFLAGKLGRKRRTGRQAPEPPPPLQSPKHRLADQQTFPDLPQRAETKHIAPPIEDDPERLERACAALVESLAEKYLELAECWLSKGQPEQAAAAWQRIIQTCPETRQAQLARERLGRLGTADNHS
jgi:hypothetical protein